MVERLRVTFVLVAVVCLTITNVEAQWRVRIKTLGGSPSAFNLPLNEPDDLRRMVGVHLSDVRAVLKQKGTGWTGRIEDLERAAKYGQVRSATLDVGKTIPWMAMRRRGRPAVYDPAAGMIWSGSAPLQIYYISFRSNGRGWKLIAPVPCGNFWVASERLTKKFIAELGENRDCFHESQEILFAPIGSAYNRDGLIMHDNADFGDTAQREGWYWLGVWIHANELHQPWTDSPPRTLSFNDVAKKLEPNQDGVFVRAPGKDPFGRPTDGHENHGMTRDQLVPMIAALSVWGNRDSLQRLWYALPEDIFGKHDFQGHWHDALNNTDAYVADPVNEIRNRSCHRNVDDRDCSLQVDTRDCSRSAFGISYNDPFCEAAKAAQNAAYAGQKYACEMAKAAQNAIYEAEVVACNLQKGIDVAAAVMKKQTGILRHTGDPLQPATYNLLTRAGVVPFSIFPVTIFAVSPTGFVLGEVNLKGGIDVLRHQATGRVPCGSQPAPDPLDCVEDMNSVVMLWMSRHTLPTFLGNSAIQSYRSRAHSYGSYYKRYCEVYGPLTVYNQCPSWEPDCCADKNCLNARLTARMRSGIASGWAPDGPGFGPYGAIRWYHRWTSGANPKLATLWEPIVADLVK